jgi:hypothetical protein
MDDHRYPEETKKRMRAENPQHEKSTSIQKTNANPKENDEEGQKRSLGGVRRLDK